MAAAHSETCLGRLRNQNPVLKDPAILVVSRVDSALLGEDHEVEEIEIDSDVEEFETRGCQSGELRKIWREHQPLKNGGVGCEMVDPAAGLYIP